VSDVKRNERLAYEAPKLVVYGDLRALTSGASGASRDGGTGATKSKASGGG